MSRLGGMLGLDADEMSRLLGAYGGWEGRTPRDHQAQVPDRLGWRASGPGDRKQLDAFLLSRAMEHDAPAVLLQLARDWLRSEQIVRPSVEIRYRRGLALLVTVRGLRPTTGSHRC